MRLTYLGKNDVLWCFFPLVDTCLTFVSHTHWGRIFSQVALGFLSKCDFTKSKKTTQF